MSYVYLIYCKKEFKSAKTCVIGIKESFNCINEYKKAAIKKLCSIKGYNENEVRIFDWHFIGDDFEFIPQNAL